MRDYLPAVAVLALGVALVSGLYALNVAFSGDRAGIG